MAKDVRERMAAGAALLLAKGGLQATSFSSVLDLTGAPRGSVYHHFPEGKDQLVAAALDAANSRTMAALDGMAGSSPETIVRTFLGLWREVLTRSEMTAGCAMLAVTVATGSPDLLNHTGAIFRTWRHRLADLLVAGGLKHPAAERFAATLIAASEGAVVMSRAEQSMEPFDLVAGEMLDALAAVLNRDELA